jgi:hypothetical protein
VIYSNDNPLPPNIYAAMIKYLPEDWVQGVSYDLHHALIDRGDVRGMPLSERRKIHNPLNLWWVRSEDHASHSNIYDKRTYYRELCLRFSKTAVDEFVRSFRWKSAPPVTVEWLESEQ